MFKVKDEYDNGCEGCGDCYACDDVPFKIGDLVDMPSFIDCFGNKTPDRKGYSIQSIRFVKGNSIPDYYRISAVKNHNRDYIEGADRFFIKSR